ncbi:hypothetical protein ES703_16050 [subsurface metagenome]
MASRGHALSRDALIRTLTAYSGITTADGAFDGTATLIDSNLIGRNDFIKEKTILIMSGDAKDEDKGATDFDNSDGKITLQGTGFSHKIKAGTIFRILNISSIEIDVANIDAKIGTAADAGDLATLFARANKIVLPTHAHALLVVHNAANLDADLDEALRDWMLDLGYEVIVADPADVAANLAVDAFDFIVISGSCVVGDAGNLANLRTADAPLLCHSAAIAESALFLGATAGSEDTQTQIEIVNNSPAWLIEQALGDLTVTASVAIQTLETEAANAIVIGEEATVTGTDLTIIKLPQGEQDDGSPTYAPFYDRYFNGVADYTNANAVWKALMAGFLHHMLHEKRFGEGTVQLKRAYQEKIPDVDFSKTAIDTALGSDPPSADAANSIVDLDQRVNLTYVLRSLWVNITSFGGGTEMTFQLWVMLNGSVVSVDSVVISALGIQNLMYIFGLLEVHADGIWITAIVDAGSTGACEGTYRYAEARK